MPILKAMIIKDIQTYFFRLPFADPVRVGNHRLLQREGFFVRLADDFGNTGLGEIAPLPGLDASTLEDCQREIRAFSQMVKTGDCQDHAFNPVVRFGLETAIFAMIEGKRRQKDPNTDVTIEIPINGLFMPDDDSNAERMQVKRLLQKGFETIKVKIGRLSMGSEAASIRRLFEASGGSVRFRLDANRSMTISRYRRYYRSLCDLPVEYVEEPLTDGDFVRAGEVGWPLAIDESLPLFWDNANRMFHGLPEAVTHAVIKPGTPAGFREVMEFFRRRENTRIFPVISSAFNTAVGICGLMLFGESLSIAGLTTHGLDTGSYLKTDLKNDALGISNGRLRGRVDILWDRNLPEKAGLAEIDP